MIGMTSALGFEGSAPFLALLDADGFVLACLRQSTGAFVPHEVARRLVACVNALRTLPTESIEAMRPERWPAVIAESLAEMQAPMLPERVIEYEVEGHPWASEEGCAPCVAGLDEEPAPAVQVFTYEEAAKARRR